MASLQERLERAKQDRTDPQDLQQRLERARSNRSVGERAVDMASDAASAVGDVFEYGYNWARGNVPGRDLPELGSVQQAGTRDKMNMALGYLTSSDPQQVADIAVDTLPGAEQKTDEQGNPIIRYQGQDYYINRPGASSGDAAQIAGEILTYLPASRYASLARNLPSRIRRAVIGEGMTSVARDKAAQALGSEQDVDFGRAMMAGATAGLFEGLTPGAVKAFRKIIGRPGFVNRKTGQLTNKGRKAARTAGLDPDQMDARLAQEFQNVARDAVGTSPVLGRPLTENLPIYGRVAQGNRYGIQLTRGQATRDPGVLTTERNIAAQSDDEAGKIMRGFKDIQKEQMEGATKRVQADLSGTEEPQVSNVSEMGANVRDRSAARADEMAREVDRAYETARSYDATVQAEAVEQLPTRMRQTVSDVSINQNNTPAAADTLQLVSKQLEEADESGGLMVKQLDSLRRQISNNINAAKNRTDRMAVTRMKNELDAAVDDAVAQRLFSGDPRAVESLKEARRLRAQFTEQFGDPESKDRIDKIVGYITQREPDASEVVSATFGWGQLGGPKESAKIMRRMKKAVGTDSPEWDQMRETGFFQLVRDAAGDAKSPKQMRSALKKAMNRNKELLDELYTKEEQRTIRQFIDTENLTQALPEELGNPPQTALALRDMLRRTASYGQSSARIHGNFGTGLLFSTIKRLIPVGKTAREARATTRPLPVPQPRAPLATAGGASLGAQNDEDIERSLRNAGQRTYNLGKRGLKRGYGLLTE